MEKDEETEVTLRYFKRSGIRGFLTFFIALRLNIPLHPSQEGTGFPLARIFVIFQFLKGMFGQQEFQ
jgi:hypothetical protein